MKKKKFKKNSITYKTRIVLNAILVAFILIGLRVAYLATVQYSTHLKLSQKPQRKVHAILPERGTIRDRFNHPLAVNKVKYNAEVRYEPIRRLFSSKERKKYVQELASFLGKILHIDSLYIEDLIHARASLFPNTPITIKESLSEKEYYTLRAREKDWPGLEMQIGYKRFYPLGKCACHIIGHMGKIPQKHFLAIAEETHLLQTYLKEREENLPVALPKGFSSSEEVKQRLNLLYEKSYRFNDFVGKSGIEKKFDELLRGEIGRQPVEVDIYGKVKKDLPGKTDAISGKRILLSISSELQSFAETLLIESETLRDSQFKQAGTDHELVNPPWIKGGAIVAMIPKTGEIVAMASYPRYDANDFIQPGPTAKNIAKWLENGSFIAEVWNGQRSLEKEIFLNKKIQIEKRFLTWERFLDAILSPGGHARQVFFQLTRVHDAVFLANACEQLHRITEAYSIGNLIDALFPEDQISQFKTTKEERENIQNLLMENQENVSEVIQEISKYLSGIPYNDDKLLVLDLCKLCIDNNRISEKLLQKLDSLTLSMYRRETQAFSCIEAKVKKLTQQLFLKHDFPKWRETHFKACLLEKRKEEKMQGKSPKPYLDYLLEKQKELFDLFWQTHRISLIESFICKMQTDIPYSSELIKKAALFEEKKKQHLTHPYFLLQKRLQSLHPELAREYLKSMRTFYELERPLWGQYRFFKRLKIPQLERDLASAFYPPSGYSHFKSQGYEQYAPLGSIFKIVTGYEALRQHYLKIVSKQVHERNLNPMTIIDESSKSARENGDHILGYKQNGQPISRIYQGGRMPKSHKSIGKVDFLDAMEQSSNLYFSLLAAEVLNEPLDLIQAAEAFGFGKPSGIDLFGETPGSLPKDLRENRTGLYAFAIGQHSLIATPLQTTLMLSAIANEGYLMKPLITRLIAGIEKQQSFHSPHFPYQEMLSDIGIFFPFFHSFKTAMAMPVLDPAKIICKRKIFLPREIREYLLESLSRIISSPRGSAHPSRIRALYGNAPLMREYLSLQHQMAGKTSTAEVLYNPALDREARPIMCKHTWFGAISFHPPKVASLQSDKWNEPELAVVVFLRYGDVGKEAAPIAAQVINKWREICKRY